MNLGWSAYKWHDTGREIEGGPITSTTYWTPVLQYGQGPAECVSMQIDFDTKEKCEAFIRKHILSKNELHS